MDWIYIKSQTINMQIEAGFSHLIGDINLYGTKVVLGPVLTSDWGLYNAEFDIMFLFSSVSESVSTRSVNDLSGLDGEFWGPDCSTISICQQLQKEFTKKIEARPFMCITWGSTWVTAWLAPHNYIFKRGFVVILSSYSTEHITGLGFFFFLKCK